MKTIQKYEAGKNLSLNRFFLIVLALVVAAIQMPMVIHEVSKVIHVQSLLNIAVNLPLN